MVPVPYTGVIHGYCVVMLHIGIEVNIFPFPHTVHEYLPIVVVKTKVKSLYKISSQSRGVHKLTLINTDTSGLTRENHGPSVFIPCAYSNCVSKACI